MDGRRLRGVGLLGGRRPNRPPARDHWATYHDPRWKYTSNVQQRGVWLRMLARALVQSESVGRAARADRLAWRQDRESEVRMIFRTPRDDCGDDPENTHLATAYAFYL